MPFDSTDVVDIADWDILRDVALCGPYAQRFRQFLIILILQLHRISAHVAQWRAYAEFNTFDPKWPNPNSRLKLLNVVFKLCRGSKGTPLPKDGEFWHDFLRSALGTRYISTEPFQSTTIPYMEQVLAGVGLPLSRDDLLAARYQISAILPRGLIPESYIVGSRMLSDDIRLARSIAAVQQELGNRTDPRCLWVIAAYHGGVKHILQVWCDTLDAEYLISDVSRAVEENPSSQRVFALLVASYIIHRQHYRGEIAVEGAPRFPQHLSHEGLGLSWDAMVSFAEVFGMTRTLSTLVPKIRSSPGAKNEWKEYWQQWTYSIDLPIIIEEAESGTSDVDVPDSPEQDQAQTANGSSVLSLLGVGHGRHLKMPGFSRRAWTWPSEARDTAIPHTYRTLSVRDAVRKMPTWLPKMVRGRGRAGLDYKQKGKDPSYGIP